MTLASQETTTCSNPANCTWRARACCRPTAVSVSTFAIRWSSKAVSFHVTGEVNGEAIDEGFTLTRDSAFNFASDIDHLLRRHQVLSPEFMSLTTHHEYDAMFENIRSQLHAWHGEAIDLDQFT
ncbi:DUF5064 family protein [Halopseudomonas sabulinigri]